MKYEWKKEDIEKAVAESSSYCETLRKLGIKTSGNNAATLKRKIKEYGIDTTHFTFHAKVLTTKQVNINDYLKKDGPVIQTYKLKERLFLAGLKKNCCEICGIDTWCGQPINCQLHHINGDNNDNRLENLQILCPNCHSQTDNYCGQANKKEPVKRYCEICGRELKTKNSTKCLSCALKQRGKMTLNKEDFIKLLKKHSGNKVQAAKELGISETSIRKWCRTFGLPATAKQLKEFLATK